MERKDRNIVIITSAIAFVLNLIIVFIFFKPTTLETILMFMKNVLLSFYLGIAVFATYCLIKEKDPKLITIGVLFTILLIFFDLSWMTYFNFRAINRLFAITFIVFILYLLILYKSKNKNVKK